MITYVFFFSFCDSKAMLVTEMTFGGPEGTEGTEVTSMAEYETTQ